MSEDTRPESATEFATVAVAGPDDDAPPPSPEEELPAGSRVGDFRIVRLLGRGGMGEVYLAEQLEPVQRQVALKLLPTGALASQERMTWFSIEAQMLATMQHPAIAQIFDAGVTDSGRPFFAMAYVDGLPLVRYCRERKLDLKQRVELFIKVCQGAQHAHQKGFIHRDLKPDNILVTEIDGIAEPRIIDFGIATAARRAMGGSSAMPQAGTPRYMSPEQADQSTDDIDARSDVFSLGAVLLELLVEDGSARSSQFNSERARDGYRTVERPSARLEMLPEDRRDAMAGRLGLSSRQLRRLLRRDLDWIVGKATAVERDQRYESAAQLAEDLRRMLRQRPVHAAPSSLRYRLERFVARNRLAVALSGLFTAALAIGVVAVVAAWLEASAERDRAESALALAEAVNEFLVQDLLASADIEVAAEGADLTVRQILERARVAAGVRFADRPLVEAGVRDALATSLRGLGQVDLAREEFERAWELQRDALGEDHPDTLMTRRSLGGVIHHLGDLDEAERIFEAVYERQLAIHGPAHVNTITTLNSLGVRDWQAGNFERARERTEQALALARQVLGDNHRETLVAKNNLARVYRHLGREEEAEQLGLAAVAGRAELFGPESLLTLEARNDLAGLYRGMGRYAEAAEQYEQIVETYVRVAGPDHTGSVISMNNLARTYGNLGRLDEAIELLGQALEHGRTALPEDAWVLAVFSMNLADLLIERGDIEPARQRLIDAEARLSEMFSDDDPRVLRARQLLERIDPD